MASDEVVQQPINGICRCLPALGGNGAGRAALGHRITTIAHLTSEPQRLLARLIWGDGTVQASSVAGRCACHGSGSHK
jgi:hypothetical protein